jgi:NAD(P)H dehydrogenase (quinone)
MRALVVYCHPIEGSFCSALRDAAVSGLRKAGHSVDIIDLAADSFNPVMYEDEWLSYTTMSPAFPPDVAKYVELVKRAEVMVLVYPTWWSSVPAQLKGWSERVFMPSVAFKMNSKNQVRPALENLRRIVTVTTFGSPWVYVKAMNDNGSRLFSRSLRLTCIHRVRFLRLAHYRMDRSTPESRIAFLAHVEDKLARL